ncbi:MAG: hypothetical protein ACFBSF_22055 [Leptolyngbyaceae cyanobacterium]
MSATDGNPTSKTSETDLKHPCLRLTWVPNFSIVFRKVAGIVATPIRNSIDLAPSAGATNT